MHTQPSSVSQDIGRSTSAADAFKESTNREPRLMFVVNNGAFFVSHRLPIALAARERGYSVSVAAPPETRASAIEEHGFTFVPLPFGRRSTGPLTEAMAVKAFVRAYRDVRPDIVHHVSLKPILYGTIAARIVGVPAVVNALAGVGYIFLNQSLSASILREFTTLAMRVALSHRNCHFIFQNPDDRQLFLDRRIARDDQSVLIRGSGVDLRRFTPQPEPSGAPLVILPSRMLWEKGVREFVDAARMLRGTGARFALVGDDDVGNPGSVSRAQLLRWADEGVVEWWGHRTDMNEVFALSNLVVLPSYGEGLPKVLLEAAACGRAIVTTDERGCRESVRHGDNGLLVAPRDAKSLADAIRSLIEDGPRRTRMAQRGRERAIAEFDVQDVANRSIRIYDHALSSPRRRVGGT